MPSPAGLTYERFGEQIFTVHNILTWFSSNIVSGGNILCIKGHVSFLESEVENRCNPSGILYETGL
jgi:hypothetical protein